MTRCSKPGCPHQQCVLVTSESQAAPSIEEVKMVSDTQRIHSAPFPIYVLLMFLFVTDQSCVETRNYHMPCMIFLLAVMMEAYHTVIIFPLKKLRLVMREGGALIDFDELERKQKTPRVMTTVQRMHAGVTIFTLWALCVAGILACRGRYAPLFMSMLPVAAVSFLVACRPIVQAYVQNRWMVRHSATTTSASAQALLLGSLMIVFGLLISSPYSTLLIQFGCFIVLGAVLHLRFAHFYKNPPKFLNLLTIKRKRMVIRNNTWLMMLINGSIWACFVIRTILSPGMSDCAKYLCACLMLLAFIPSAIICVKWAINKIGALLRKKLEDPPIVDV